MSRRPGASQAFTMQATVGSTPQSTSITDPLLRNLRCSKTMMTRDVCRRDRRFGHVIARGGGRRQAEAPGEDGMGAIRFSKGEEARPLEEMDYGAINMEGDALAGCGASQGAQGAGT